MSATKLLLNANVKDILVCDRRGIIQPGNQKNDVSKEQIAKITNRSRVIGGLADALEGALEGADVFIGVSGPQVLDETMVRKMNKDAIVFAMANPVPEIWPEDAKAGGARVIGTGRSDFPNQVNNVLAFPGIFKGALAVRATDINEEMKLAAAYAIAELVKEEELDEENVIPKAFDKRVGTAVALGVAKAALETGVARLDIDIEELEKKFMI
ncbi:MAG: hypothetical protein JJT76_03405 [Clostridiaceae bacterium]|nr:hypothetical protein [Clostridiaceae bacterium]